MLPSKKISGGDCLSEDWWTKWFRGRRFWPFTGRWMFDDVDEFIREMESIMQKEFEDLSKTAPKSLIRERTLSDGRRVTEWGPFVYGYSVTMGPDGRPNIREFGNIKPETRRGRPQISVKEQREPLVDVLTTNGEIRIVAEVPGVEKNDIELHGTENYVTISVATPQRRYYKKIDLPTDVDMKKAKSTYKNGVLEVTIPKIEKTRAKGERIHIE